MEDPQGCHKEILGNILNADTMNRFQRTCEMILSEGTLGIKPGDRMPVGECNIRYKGKIFDDDLIDIHDTIMNYWGETQEMLKLPRTRLPKERTLFSNQDYVSRSFVENMTKAQRAAGDIYVVKDHDGELWIIDWHHRLCYDRMHGLDSRVFLIDRDSVEAIKDMFYSAEE